MRDYNVKLVAWLDFEIFDAGVLRLSAAHSVPITVYQQMLTSTNRRGVLQRLCFHSYLTAVLCIQERDRKCLNCSGGLATFRDAASRFQLQVSIEISS